MVVSHTTTVAIEDLTALSITCSCCGASVLIPISKEVTNLTKERSCTACGRPLWRGGDDTAFARELIAARVGKRTRFAMVIDPEAL